MSMKQWMLVVGFFSLSSLLGCTHARACNDDSDCAPFGAVCDPDWKLCVIAQDAGIDAGDADGGVDAGLGDAGTVDSGMLGTDAGLIDAGSDGGTFDGGHPTPTCLITCAPWESCEETLDGGLCHSIILSSLTPDSGAEFASGASAGVTVTATQFDSSAYSGPIPFAVNGTVAGTLFSGVASPTLLAHSGRYVLLAGWTDGGPNITSTLYARGCEAASACPPWQECGPSSSGVWFRC
jgi:hypothetical protein